MFYLIFYSDILLVYTFTSTFDFLVLTVSWYIWLFLFFCTFYNVGLYFTLIFYFYMLLLHLAFWYWQWADIFACFFCCTFYISGLYFTLVFYFFMLLLHLTLLCWQWVDKFPCYFLICAFYRSSQLCTLSQEWSSREFHSGMLQI